MPKCGGTSIRVSLRAAFNWPLARSRRHFFHVSPRRSNRAADLASLPLHVLRDAMLRYHLCDERIRLLTGHYRWPVGIRDEFPGVNLITLLREPVSHFLSMYFFQREERGQAKHRRVTADLDTFLESERALAIGSTFVRYLTGPNDCEVARDEETIGVAARHLASVEVLGVLEDLPGFSAAFQERFGVLLRIPRANAGRLRPQLEQQEVTAAHRARIRDLVLPNQALYDVALAEIRRRRG